MKKLSSTYKTEAELKKDEDAFKNITTQIDNQVQQDSSFETFAIKGDWAWSSYQQTTITWKTATIITAAILSRIPFIGWVAAALASIAIARNMKVGCSKWRIGNTLDTAPN